MEYLTLSGVLFFIFNLISTSQQGGCPFGLSPPPDLSFDFPCTKSPRTCLNRLKYRTLDGTCNNIQHPVWGAGYYLYGRMAPPNYGDGISAFPLSSTGNPLPNARTLSLELFGDDQIPDPKLALGQMSFGQLVAHDLGMQIDKTEFFDFCCDGDGQYLHCDPNHIQCATIDIPADDAVYPANFSCLNFVRSVTDRDIFCQRYAGRRKFRPVEQVNGVSAFADLSIIYGSTEDAHTAIRSFVDGKLLVDTRYGVNWPQQSSDGSCELPNESCFLFADGRANQNPGLTLFHMYFYQEHNRLADELKLINPWWDDEKLFQEARRINIAQYQQITYYEYLPLLVGEDILVEKKIIYKGAAGYINDYDSTVDPSSLNEFSNAAFRFFHSQIEGQIELFEQNRSSVGAIRLSDWFNRPRLLDDNNGINFERIGRGLTVQNAEATDLNFDPEIKHFLFKRSHPFGLDLRATDITRGRDHGLASYNTVRQFCGLKRAQTWKCFEDHIPKYLVDRLENLYESPDDVDLVIGGALEYKIGDFLTGPTFTCLILNQFYQIRVGDRFFFENDGNDDHDGFTLDQLAEIRKASIARIYCDHVKNLQNVQPKAFESVSTANRLIDCSEIPSLDLNQWRE